MAYEAPGLPSTPDVPTRGFEGLEALGQAGGIKVARCPLRTELLKMDDAEVVDGILLNLPRPTLVMCTERCCKAGCAETPPIYIIRKASG